MKKARTIEEVFDQISDWMFNLGSHEDWIGGEESLEASHPDMTPVLNRMIIKAVQSLPHTDDTVAAHNLPLDIVDALGHRIVAAKKIALMRHGTLLGAYPDDLTVMTAIAIGAFLSSG